eukprot:snap_masked-scaffold_1-processed-gene-23.53-mRNA-1 protein AED:0.02 eAED:0.02 QI:0/-1/0/1/-1/1/1/0/213
MALKTGIPKFFLIVYNISKKANVGNIVRSACAFGVHEVLVIGQKKNLQLFGSQNTDKYTKFVFFDSLDECKLYLAENFNCSIVGIEIHPKSKSILESPFEEGKDVAFMLGNEGTGLNQKQKEACDYFVYIPHYGNGTASLNVTVAGSIILHHFANFAGYQEIQRKDEKYVVKPIEKSFQPINSITQIRLEKKKRAQEESKQVLQNGFLGNMLQ